MRIHCNYQLFRISDTLINLLTSLGFVAKEKNQNFVFEFSETLLLQIFCKLVPITKPTHCYVFVKGSPKKHRINYKFYTFLINTQKNIKGNSFIHLDKFYTKPKIARYCVSLFQNQFKVTTNDLILEPSAGNGSFLVSLNTINCKKCYIDISPENKQILKQDFLKYNVTKKTGKIHVIGNPPFGKQSSMAIKFIKHAAIFADSISFKKDSLKNRIPLNFHLRYQIDLPKDIFFVNEKLHNVFCVFQIWEKKNYLREKILPLKPKNFVFVKKTQNPHLAFCRVGGNSGKSSINWLNKNIETHYFIRFNSQKTFEKFLELQKTLTFESENTVAAKSISKQELTKLCDNLL